MSKSMLTPPEREQYFLGSAGKAVGKAISKKGKELYDKASRKVRTELDKSQGITSESPGRTAESRGAVIGKDRTKAFKNTEQVIGGVKTAAVVIPATAIATAWLSKDNKGKPSSEFEKAFSEAHNAGEDTFIFKGEVYSTEVRKGKEVGGEVYDQELSYVPPSTAYEQRQQAERDFQERLRKNEEQVKMRQLIRENKGMTVEQAYAEVRRKDDEARKKYDEDENRLGRANGGLPDLTGDGKITQADVLKGRGVFNEGGSMMMPPEGIPVDTYPNIPEDEMDEALASQLPDDEMEDDYISYVMDESLDDDEQDYLAGVLQNDPRLSDILDKVITVASEFSGAGEVEGPGTGVSDSIPARLSDGEFVFTRKATDQIGADQLQTIMDDAERAYDGGYQMKAIGGYMQEDPEEQDSPLSQTDEEIKKLMMGANKMPSLQ